MLDKRLKGISRFIPQISTCSTVTKLLLRDFGLIVSICYTNFRTAQLFLSLVNPVTRSTLSAICTRIWAEVVQFRILPVYASLQQPGEAIANSEIRWNVVCRSSPGNRLRRKRANVVTSRADQFSSVVGLKYAITVLDSTSLLAH
ncbi:hypothetical protein BN2476_110212 [Paraburkholderia piptadeniae]|uniref:Uncharacterized protein n=1 Tax=Paraburkholderia piptadeniae TaxID=1701573 RepID=A0A1N7RQ92_9BURK|nr:hypothetical protein BN2476_110212 [Paraburkholderia piptadeniae]